jgi:phage baseplate assembly protein W
MAVSYADKFTTTPLFHERYSDFYLNFNRNIGSGDIARLTNDDAIYSTLKNIVLTKKGERPFFPEFGCNIVGLLFENYSEFTRKTAEAEVRTAIENFEPRVSLIKLVVDGNPDSNQVSIVLYFTIINRPETYSVGFLLSRIR